MNRRVFLRNAACAAAVTGAATWYTCHEGVLGAESGDAYAAWRMQSGTGDPGPLTMVRAAVLASSPHNTQPWKFRIADDFIEMYLERRRSVGGLDPYLREAHIGMGCALENLLLAGEALGYRGRVAVPAGKLGGQPDGNLELVARIDLERAAVRVQDLYNAIPHRHTNRSPYDPQRPLPENFSASLASACQNRDGVRLFLFEGAEQRDTLAEISNDANVELYSQPEVESGNQQWIRWRESDIEKYKDGLTIDNFGLAPPAAAAAKLSPMWLLRRMSAPSERSKMYRSQMRSARLIGMIAVRDRMDVGMSLQAGQIWQRAHLLATVRGVAARPCNEAIEMVDRERVLGKEAKRLALLQQVSGDEEWQPTFLFLMGMATRPAHLSPRRPAAMVMMDGEHRV